MEKYIKGTFKRSIYNSDKGYIIGIFKIIETDLNELENYINKTITFTGYFAELNEDENYIFYGETIEHPKYGFQFQVTKSERIKPSDKEGIIEFLSSDLFIGIGKKIAKEIVEILGEDVLNKIIEDKESLNLVPKLTLKKQKLIYDTLIKYEESHQTIIYLTELGFTLKDSLSIYNKYKSNTIINLEHNIYSISDEIPEINFIKIDEIAKKTNIELNDSKRVKACIHHILKKISFETGDTYFSLEEIYKAVCKFLNMEIDDTYFINYINELVMELKIIIEDEKYYLKSIYDAENNIVNCITNLLHKPVEKYKKFDNYLNQVEEAFEIKYNKKQKQAIKSSLENNITIITGGPGTGKTTIIKGIVEMYSKINKYEYQELVSKLALLAPTGRASKRMSESTLYPATTIHRFLKWNKDDNSFAVNKYNPDFSNLIIIDEVSMIDIELMNNLFLGLTKNVKLVLVGDYNQLPSVGPGQILKDLIESEIIEIIELELLYRQKEESYIPLLAEEIKNNQLTEIVKTTNDYTFLKCNKESIKNNLEKVCKQIINKGYDYKRVQIMAPMYAGINGIDELNKDLQNIFNPIGNNKLEIKYGDIIFRENDKILQLVNMPEENVFNGDVGIIKHIITSDISKSHKNEIIVDYDGFEVKYLPEHFNRIKHGFIISIHKSQGSEFEVVILPISMSYYRMLYRKLIYTAVTRAKKKLIIIGEDNAFIYSVKNNNEKFRKTNLSKRLKNMYINNDLEQTTSVCIS